MRRKEGGCGSCVVLFFFFFFFPRLSLSTFLLLAGTSTALPNEL